MVQPESPNYIINAEGDPKPSYTGVNQPRYSGPDKLPDHYASDKVDFSSAEGADMPAADINPSELIAQMRDRLKQSAPTDTEDRPAAPKSSNGDTLIYLASRGYMK